MKLQILYRALSVGLLMAHVSYCMDEASKPLPDEISVISQQDAPTLPSQAVSQASHGAAAQEEDYDYDEDEDDNDEQEEVLFVTPDNIPLSQNPVPHIEYKPQPVANNEGILNTQVTHLKEIQSDVKDIKNTLNEIKNALNELIEFKRPVLP